MNIFLARPRSSNATTAVGCALVLSLLIACSSEARAGLITYTETGTASGSLGSTGFTNATVTVTTVADTANITLIYVQGFATYENPGTTTVSISGLGTVSMAGDQFGSFSQNDSSFGNVGILDITKTQSILYNVYSLPFYDLSGETTLTGVGGSYGGGGATFETSGGTLTMTSVTGNATFAAAAIPEPSSLVLTSIAVVGIMVYAGRRGADAKKGGRNA